MSDFISAWDAAEDASYNDQKAIREEIFEIAQRLRREMDAGVSPEDMKVLQAEKAAAEAADEILSKLFN